MVRDRIQSHRRDDKGDEDARNSDGMAGPATNDVAAKLGTQHAGKDGADQGCQWHPQQICNGQGLTHFVINP